MTPRLLLINPWIHDFAAFSLWARPLGLYGVAEYLSAFDADLVCVDCADAVEPKAFGTGRYSSAVINKPELLRAVPRRYKRYGHSPDAIRSRLRALLPLDAVLMTSSMAYWYPGVQETIRLVREVCGSIPIVLGGIYPTLYPEHAIRQSGADAIFCGPVNDGLISRLEDLDIKVGRRSSASKRSVCRSSLHQSAPLLTSIGCPYRCTYCASSLLSPHYQRRDTADIMTEVRRQAAQGVTDFAFYDDALLFDADRHIKPLLDAIVSSGMNLRLHTPNGLHARFIDAELARLMKQSGFTTIRLSLETIDPAIQLETGGKIATPAFERAVERLLAAGFTKKQLGSYLLYGLPGQDWDDVEAGVRFLKRLDLGIYLSELSPIKGTAAWAELVQRGIIPDDLDPLLTNNSVYSYLFSGYDREAVRRLRLDVNEHNRKGTAA